jgi:hypothetical protein
MLPPTCVFAGRSAGAVNCARALVMSCALVLGMLSWLNESDWRLGLRLKRRLGLGIQGIFVDNG